MYCYKCGLKIEAEIEKCPGCGANTAHVLKHKPWSYKASIIFAVLLLAAPYSGFLMRILALPGPYYIIIFGAIGLPLAILSKQKSAIIINFIAIILWVLLIITPFFAKNAPTREEHLVRMESYSEYTK